MSDNQQRKQCDNCKKEFPIDKIDLHQAYCFRNIKKCPQCQAMVDINQQEAHQAEIHTNKQCQMCKQSFSPELFQEHQVNCPKKLVHCQYCQNSYANIEILKHKQACGSRTKPCTICQRLTMIKDFAGHQQRCLKRREQRRQERVDISQDRARQPTRNQQNQRERQNSQKVRERRISSTNKNLIPSKQHKIKPSHMIGPQIIKPSIDPVPISIRAAMKVKQQQRMPLKSKN